MGLVSFFLVPSTLRDSRFLTEDQKELVPPIPSSQIASLHRDIETLLPLAP